MPDRAPGLHLLLDLTGPRHQRDAAALEAALRDAAGAGDATVLSAAFHRFGEGGGVTGVLLLSESHISIHKWPEHDFAAVDIFMCGGARPRAAAERLRAVLAPRDVCVTEVPRRAGIALSGAR